MLIHGKHIFIISAIRDFIYERIICEYPRIPIQLYYLFENHLSLSLLQFIVLFYNAIKTEASVYTIFFSLASFASKKKKKEKEKEIINLPKMTFLREA